MQDNRPSKAELIKSRDVAAELMVLLKDKEALFDSFFEELEKGYRNQAADSPNWEFFCAHRAVADFIRGFLMDLPIHAHVIRDQYEHLIDEYDAEPNSGLH